jgi:hypothetical protein
VNILRDVNHSQGEGEGEGEGEEISGNEVLMKRSDMFARILDGFRKLILGSGGLPSLKRVNKNVNCVYFECLGRNEANKHTKHAYELASSRPMLST